MLQVRRSVMLRDLVIFLVKLAIDGLKDLVLMNLALGAAVLDLISGGGTRPRLFYSVLRLSERFDLWLNLNGAMEQMDSGQAGEDGLFGASKAGSDTLLGKIEELVRGGDTPRGARAAEDARRSAEPVARDARGSESIDESTARDPGRAPGAPQGGAGGTEGT